jgi:CDP-4-dehydro-6-deoxyglucose reductase
MEHAIYKKTARPMHLYWGCRSRQDLYLHELAQALVQQATQQGLTLSYVPVLSEPKAGDDWQGRTGLVHQAVMRDLADLSGYQVYACGAPVMVESARADFTRQCGLPAEEFYADAFTSAADK